MRRAVLSFALLAGLLVAPVGPGAPPPAAHAAPSDVVALVFEGTGFGHGRGMSQWGAYGWAVEHGWSWQQILDFYYGNTQMGDRPGTQMSVRLLGYDNVGTIDVTSAAGGVTWGPHTRPSMRAVWNGSAWNIYGSPDRTCAVPQVEFLGSAPDVTFTTAGGDDWNLDAGSALGLCRGDGSVAHYRGALQMLNSGGLRVVNHLSTENYLRGVVPREVAASWAAAGGGRGANAVRAQAVAARSYALAESRYAFAKTCDTTACQAYSGAATRPSATAERTIIEHSLSDAAVWDTAGKVRVRGAQLVRTEFSASNGPRTAGGDFPVVDDAGDAVRNNPNHRWTRVIDADAVAQRYGLGTITSATMVEAASATNRQFDGIWYNDLLLNGSTRVEAWTLRGDYNLPSPGFTVRAVTRDTTNKTFGFIGDSVGNSIAGGPTAEFSTLIDGMFPSAVLNMRDGRCIAHACAGGGDPLTNGAYVASTLPANLDLVVVELGYNQVSSAGFAADVDTMMNALTARGVQQVAWVNLATAPGAAQSATYAQRNAALIAATTRWGNLTILDWDSASRTSEWPRWFADHAHLTNTGQARFAVWLRDQVSTLAPSNPFRAKVTSNRALRFKVAGVGGVPAHASAVALNVTAVDPAGWGFLTVWPCGSPMPDASNVNFVSAGATEPNSVLAKIDGTGDVCVYTSSTTHVLVDVAGWFSSGFESLVPDRTVDTRNGIGAPKARVMPGTPLRVRVAGVGGVPAHASAVALNVTAVDPTGWGFLTVWPCGSPMPDASNVNYVAAGAVEPNSVLAKVDATGEVCIHTHAPTNVLVDIAGWFSSGFESLVPNRIVDTRNGIGAPKAKVNPGAPLRVRVADVGGVPAHASAVALNVTAVDPAGWGYLTVWPCGSPMPDASHVNFVRAGAVEPNSVLAKVDATGEICIYPYASTNVLVDVAGWFSSGFESLVPNRIVDTRNGIGTQ